jgi:hypothetical protein
MVQIIFSFGLIVIVLAWVIGQVQVQKTDGAAASIADDDYEKSG